MDSFLIVGAHFALGYVFFVQSYLAFKELTRERSFTFLELFMYIENNSEENIDKILKAIKEEGSKTQHQNFENSQRAVARIKKLMQDDKTQQKDD